MPNVKIGDKDAYRDWGIVLQPMVMPAPQAKTYYVDVPGRDGKLDLTETLGEVKYENREFELIFYCLDKAERWSALMQEISGYLHGQKMKLVFEDDETYFYLARLSVDRMETDKRLGIITINGVAEPYKYKLNETVISETVNGEKISVLTNDRMTAQPMITVETGAQISLQYEDEGGSRTHVLSAGSYTLPDFILKEGEKTVQLNGEGEVIFAWQEGAL